MKFDKPIDTKSGHDIVKIWNDLKEEWRLYKKFTYFEPNKEQQITHAKQIRHLQDDLGLTLSKFPDLNLTESNSSVTSQTKGSASHD